MKKIAFLFFTLILAVSLEAQFGRVLDMTTRSVQRKVEDKIVEKLADEIAKQIYKPIDKSIDEMMKEKYQDSTGQEDVDWEKAGKAYGDFLAGMNASAGNIADVYTFDLVNDLEIIDEDGKKNQMQMFFSKTEPIIGIKTFDKKQSSLVIMDMKKDLFVLYTEDEKGNKKGQALPSMMNLVASFSKTSEEDQKEPKIKNLGPGKSYAGYATTGYEVESEDYISKIYVAEKYPIEWNETFGQFMKKFAPAQSNSSYEKIKGMTMHTETKSVKPKSKASTSTVTKVSTEKVAIKKADYTFASV